MNAKMDTGQAPARPPRIAYCETRHQLLSAFMEVVQDLVLLHDQQVAAIVNGDQDFARLDLLIHMANEKKQNAKYAYLSHLEAHGCGDPQELQNPESI